jgi:DDE superfamily endonuclease
MLTLPEPIIAILAPFAPLFSRPVFAYAQVLLVGVILTPGRRTVASALRVMGRSQAPDFQNYHRVLNRAHWSARKAARTLLHLLVETFVPEGPIVIGGDETLERRRGDKIAKKGIYKDSARSSKSFFVKSSGLRWIVFMLLVPIPWAGRVWALPFFAVLAPSERYHQQRQKRHKTLVDWTRQMLKQVRRWLPERRIIFVGDGSYSVLELLQAAGKQQITVVTRLRLDAGLYTPAPPKPPKGSGKTGRPRVKGARLPLLEQIAADPDTEWTRVQVPRWYSHQARQVEIVSACCVWYSKGLVVPIRYVLVRDPRGKFETQALLCTDFTADPVQILSWFVQRWQLEVTFQEVRRHLGVETQRQWNDQAIDRTTPVLMGLFSMVTLMARPLIAANGLWVRQASWYCKQQATFSDTLALVRYPLWQETTFGMSGDATDFQKVADLLLERMTETLCYAA